MKRYLETHIKKDLSSKLVLLTGPRQCGKTYLSKQLYPAQYDYLNYDSVMDRLTIKEQSWDRAKKLIIFDELHKMKSWKRWLKGVYDTQGIPPEIIVTGSARLDISKKMGDSLAGRFFQFRLHPIDMKEAVKFYDKDEAKVFEQLWTCSGFPEPFLKNDATFYRRWRKSHTDIILRQDLIDLYSVRDITAIETLVLLLRSRVGGTVSYANLARDLERDPNTIKRWLQLLENLYIIFRVRPYQKNIARSILKEPKFYFYDHNNAKETGGKLENIVASALLKEIHYIEDTTGRSASLHYLRNKEGKEIDFLVVVENKPILMLEVKQKDADPSSGFEHYSRFLPGVKQTQLVRELAREKTFPNGLEVRRLVNWLAHINILNYLPTD